MNSVIAYCLSNNIRFVWVNEFNIIEYVDGDILEKSNNEDIIKNWNKLKGAIYAARIENQKNH